VRWAGVFWGGWAEAEAKGPLRRPTPPEGFAHAHAELAGDHVHTCATLCSNTTTPERDDPSLAPTLSTSCRTVLGKITTTTRVSLQTPLPAHTTSVEKSAQGGKDTRTFIPRKVPGVLGLVGFLLGLHVIFDGAGRNGLGCRHMQGRVRDMPQRKINEDVANVTAERALDNFSFRTTQKKGRTSSAIARHAAPCLKKRLEPHRARFLQGSVGMVQPVSFSSSVSAS